MSEKKRKGKDKNLPAKYKKSRKVLKIISVIFLCVFLVVFAGCIYIGVKVSDVVAEEIDNCADFVAKVSTGEISNLDLSTFMYDKDGNKIDVLYGNENRIELKYDSNKPVIQGLKRISKPGLRNYVEVENLPRVLNGLGIAIISTSKGIVTDKEARKLNVGGEVMAFVW